MYKYLRNSLNIFINTMYLYKVNKKMTFTFVTKIVFLHCFLYNKSFIELKNSIIIYV